MFENLTNIYLFGKIFMLHNLIYDNLGIGVRFYFW